VKNSPKSMIPKANSATGLGKAYYNGSPHQATSSSTKGSNTRSGSNFGHSTGSALPYTSKKGC